VFVAWASTFEEHNSLRTGLKHFPNFSSQVPGTCGSKLGATEPHIHMSPALVLGSKAGFSLKVYIYVLPIVGQL
jgi:hypothetical protein